MKKLLGCFLCVMLLFCLAAPVVASTCPPDEFIDSTILYAPNKSDLDEQAWLEGIVGTLEPITTMNFADGPKLLEDYDPGIVGWTYAIVKIGEGSINGEDWLFAYLDMPEGLGPAGLDNILTVDTAGPGNTYNEFGYKRGVSHIQFFGPHSVPEPATMFLLGAGLIGLALFGRQRFKR
jgi:hypothetical protein